MHKCVCSPCDMELDSISSSFDESLSSRLRGLSPVSFSLPWLSSAVDVLTFAHSSVKSLIDELTAHGAGDSLSSLYLDNSLKVLDVCNCISSEMERLRVRLRNLRIVTELLCSDSNPSEEEIHQVRDSLADPEGVGDSRYVNHAANAEELIRDLAARIGTSEPWWKVSRVERVVRRAVSGVNFVTAFIAGVISSALRTSSAPVICVRIPKKFPWVDSVLAIEWAVVAESGHRGKGAGTTRVSEELCGFEALARHELELMEDVTTSEGREEISSRLRAVAMTLGKATEGMPEGLERLREKVEELFDTVITIRTEMVD